MFDLKKSKLLNPNSNPKYFTTNQKITLEVDHQVHNQTDVKNNLENYEYYWFSNKTKSKNSQSIYYINKNGPKLELTNLDKTNNGSKYYCLLVNTKDLSQPSYYWQETICYRSEDFEIQDAEIRVGLNNHNDGFNNWNTPVFLYQTNDELKMNIHYITPSEYSSNLKFEWFKSDSTNLENWNDLKQYKYVTTNNTPELSFDNLSVKDSGTYICKVWLEKTDDSTENIIKSEKFITKPIVLNVIDNLTFKSISPIVESKTNGSDFNLIELSEIRENSEIKITPQIKFDNLPNMITPNNFISNSDILKIECEWFKVLENNSEEKIVNTDKVYVESGILHFKEISKNEEGKYKSKIKIFFKDIGFKERNIDLIDIKIANDSKISAVFDNQDSWNEIYNGQEKFDISITATLNNSSDNLNYQWFYYEDNTWKQISNLNKPTLSLNKEQIVNLNEQKFKCIISSSASSNEKVELITSPITCIHPKIGGFDKFENKYNQQVGSIVAWNANTTIINAPDSSLDIHWKPKYHWQKKKDNEEWHDIDNVNLDNPVYTIKKVSLNDNETKVRCFVSIDGIVESTKPKYYENLGESTLFVNYPKPEKLTVYNIQDMIDNLKECSKSKKDIETLNEIVKKYLGISNSNLQNIYFELVDKQQNFFNVNNELSTNWNITVELKSGYFNNQLGSINNENINLINTKKIEIKNVNLNLTKIQILNKRLIFTPIEKLFSEVKYLESLQEQIDHYGNRYFDEFLNINSLDKQYVSNISLDRIQDENRTNNSGYNLNLKLKNGFIIEFDSNQMTELNHKIEYDFTEISESLFGDNEIKKISQHLADLYMNNTSVNLNAKYTNPFEFNIGNVSFEVQLEICNPNSKRTHRRIATNKQENTPYMSPSVYLYEFKIKANKNLSINKEQLRRINDKIYEFILKKIENNNILKNCPSQYLNFKNFKEIVQLSYDELENNFYLTMDSRILTINLDSIKYLKKVTSLYKKEELAYNYSLAFQALGINNLTSTNNYFYYLHSNPYVMIMGNLESNYENVYVTFDPNQLVINFQTDKYFVPSEEIINELENNQEELNIKLDHKNNQKAFIFKDIQYGNRILNIRRLSTFEPIFGNKKVINMRLGMDFINLVYEKIGSSEIDKSKFNYLVSNERESIYTLVDEDIKAELLNTYGLSNEDVIDVFGKFNDKNIKYANEMELFILLKIGNGVLVTGSLNTDFFKLDNFGTTAKEKPYLVSNTFGYFYEKIRINKVFIEKDTDLPSHFIKNDDFHYFSDLITIKGTFKI